MEVKMLSNVLKGLGRVCQDDYSAVVKKDECWTDELAQSFMCPDVVMYV